MSKKGNYCARDIGLDARARDLQNDLIFMKIGCRLTEIFIDLPFGVVEKFCQ